MEERKEQTRVRINYSVSAKGIFKPDITTEAECVETAMFLLKQAHNEVQEFAKENGTLE